MNKKIYKYEDIKEKIIHAVDTITEPIASTLSPKGNNVIYEDNNGNQNLTNDGATIAKYLSVADPVENAIIEVIKGASLRTNLEAGDGTSSTVLMSSVLIKEGLRMVENGWNHMDVRDAINGWASDMKEALKKKVSKVSGDKDLQMIAKISANNDEVIAKDIVKIMKCVGEDGQVFLDEGFSEETEIIEDMGFVIKSGLFDDELGNRNYQSKMLDVPVFITDKRLYYKSEAETILKTVINSGYNEVVVIAQDFLGECLPYFVANHKNGKVRVILVQEKRREILEDLAIYLGGEVISDKKGSLVDNITIEDFMLTNKCFSDKFKTVVTRDKNEKNPELKKRVEVLREELKANGNKNDSEYQKLKQRISSLTSGMVTVKIGGRTRIEMIERVYRYEDAVNATRAAMKEGWLPGGGVSVYNGFKNIKVKPEFEKMFRAAAEVNIRQIALNCGANVWKILDTIDNSPVGFGYNAVNDKVEDMVKAGIIEPFLVTSQVIANAASIANVILTSKYLIVNDVENYKDSKENK